MNEVLHLAATPKQITFVPILKDICIYPSMLRLTHIYTRFEAHIAIKQAFKQGMGLYYTENDVSEMMLADNEEDALFTTILIELIKVHNKNPKRLGMLQNLHHLESELPQQQWMNVYENLMVAPPGDYDKECDNQQDDFEDAVAVDEDNHANLHLFCRTNIDRKKNNDL